MADFDKKVEGNEVTPDTVQESSKEKRRVTMYEVYWRFYLGRHWRYAAERGVPQLTFNFCKAFVDKSVAFLTGNGFKINEPNNVKVKTEDILNKVWDYNDRGTKLLEIAQSGGVTGDVWVKVGYDDTKKEVVISVVNPATVFPTFDKYDSSKIEKIIIVGEYYSSSIGNKHKFREEFSEKEIVEYDDDKEVVGTRRENVIGELPIVHISNLPVPFSFWGQSDLSPIVSLNKEFNEKATDLSDTLNYQGSPIVIVKGAKTRNLQRGPNQVWGGLPRDSQVDTLDISGATSEVSKYLELIKQSMHELSGIPEATLGKMQPISNTSAAALEIQYLPLMEKTKVKRLSYGKGIKEVNRLILKTLEVKEELNLGKDKERYITEIIFPSPLPKDEQKFLQNAQMELNMGVASKKEIAIRMGKDNIDEILEDAQKDRQEEESTPFLASQEPLNEEEIIEE